LAGVSVGASLYRRLTRRRLPADARFVVRVRVDNHLLSDLVDFVRALQGRAVLQGDDALSIPLAQGVSKIDVYRDLRAALDKWELRHPGVRASILDGEVDLTDQRQRTDQAVASSETGASA
jgi:hypothetical protein